ncbi:MAG TPA: hypothetical protein VLT35_01100 [Methanocella sp.]|nr:hypothetical protein [Methanocella sp.]
MLSIVVVLSMVGAPLFAGMADGQQFQQQPATGNVGAQAPSTAGGAASPVIQGLEGLRGFGSGHSQLSLAVIPLSQQGNQLNFQVIGFAVSIPETGEAVIYSLETPLPGVIDPSQNTLQIDISDLADAVSTAGYDDASDVYDIIRSDPQVMVIDIDLNKASQQGSQTYFNVNSVDMIMPDGRMQTFSLQQPTQFVIDTENDIVAMVAFPEMVNSFSSFSSTAYDTVAPVVYSQPVPVVAPIVTPYLYPIPFYGTSFVWYNRFAFGAGFRPFWNVDRVANVNRVTNVNRVGHFDRVSNVNVDRFPAREARNDFADRSRNAVNTAQRRGDFTQSRNLGRGVSGGIGGYRGGVSTPTAGARMGGSVRAGGARMGGGRGGGRR